MTAELDRGAVLAALGQDGSGERDALAATLVDFVLAQKVGTLVHAEEVVDVVLAALTEGNVQRALERWIEPAWERHRARSEAAGDTVGEAVPDREREAIRKLQREARMPKARWAKGAVDPQLVRDLLAPVLQQTLLGFVKDLPVFGGGGGGGAGGGGGLGGLAGAFGKRALERAGKLADAGRGMLGGALDERVQHVARDFSRTALGGMREAVRKRLKSDEGKALVGKMREQFFDRLLEAEVADLMKDAELVPFAEVRQVAATLVAFNARRDFVRDAVRAEIDAWLALEGDRTVGDLLDEAGLDAKVRQVAIPRVRALIDAFAGFVQASSSSG